MTLIATAFICIAIIGCLYTTVAALAVRAFFERRAVSGHESPESAVTVLKPLHGAEPGLYENLSTFFHQDYSGPVQVLFGVSGAADTARPIVQRLIVEYPRHDIRLVVGPAHVEGNGKIANLCMMATAIKHDVIVLSDSDIAVTRDYLRVTCRPLADPEVGLVTCIYRGASGAGLWARLSAMAIDFHFLPSVLLGIRIAKARPCMGATIALSRKMLVEIGGFDAFKGHLADDYAIGEAVRAAGRRVVISPGIVVHQCNERSASDLFFHELRWARTIRSIDPVGFAGSLVTHPLPFAVAAVASGGSPMAALVCLGATMACRSVLQWQVERAFGEPTHRWVLGPLRDAISFVVYLASFVTDEVVWRGRRYRVHADGTMEERKGVLT